MIGTDAGKSKSDRKFRRRRQSDHAIALPVKGLYRRNPVAVLLCGEDLKLKLDVIVEVPLDLRERSNLYGREVEREH